MTLRQVDGFRKRGYVYLAAARSRAAASSSSPLSSSRTRCSRHTHDVDPSTGNLTEKVEHYTSPYERCGGSGVWF
ncbi:hypothetical protein OG535_40700 [Kitasatospora sp. NBC_00085]|uniref:hypothetical protein n=1 Tax=unclassified Kitasatospora TaxID=2633591 RepID=UPI0032473E47